MLITQRKKQQRRWLDHDFALAEAVHILDSEKCPSCGTPAWWAFSENNEIQFEIEEETCHSCAALDEHKDKQKDSKHGVTPRPKPVHVDWELGMDTPMPGRQDWYAEMHQKAEREAERKAKKRVVG